jgi:hypothetical protein
MRQPTSLYRVGGIALILGAVLMIPSIALRVPHPVSLASASDFDIGPWVLAFWCMAIGVFLLLGGWVALSEHFQHTPVEGWGMMGLAGFILGAVGMFAAAAINAEGVPTLLDGYLRGGTYEQQAEGAYQALRAIVGATEVFCWSTLWTGVAFSSIAIAQDAEYPRMLGYTGILMSAAAIASLVLPIESLIHDLLAMIGFVWIGIVGYIFIRIEGIQPTDPRLVGQRPVSVAAAD